MSNVYLVLIIAIALLLRVYDLANNPIALNQDEAINGYDAYSLITTMGDHHGNFMPIMLESFGDWVSPVITYITIPFVQLLGLSEFSIRLPVALLGVGTVVLIYLFSLQVFNDKKLALIAAFFLAIMPWHITLSRWAIPPSIVPFFLLLFMTVFLGAIKNNSKEPYYKFILASLCAGILTYSYPTQKLFVPLLLIALSVIFLRKNITKITIFLSSYIIFVSPLYLITLADPNRYNSRFKFVSIFRPGENIFMILGKFLLRYLSYFSPEFNFGISDSNIMQRVPGFGANYDFLSVFFYIGILGCFTLVLKKDNLTYPHRQIILLLLAWLLIAPIPASLTETYYHTLRMIHGLPLTIIFVVFGLKIIVNSLKDIQIKNKLVLVIIFLGIMNIPSFGYVYFYRYPQQTLTREMFQYGIKDFMNYVITNQDRFAKIVIDNQINQPYIYYLFYSKYDPKLINHLEIQPDKEIKTIGKYEFRNIDNQEIIDTQEIYKVNDKNRIWYKIYERNDQVLFVKKVTY